MSDKNPSFDALVSYIVRGTGQTAPLAWDRTSFTVDLGVFANEPEMLAAARRSFDVWTASAGFEFTEVTGGADIDFTADPGGAYAGTDASEDGLISGATINVATDWMDGSPEGERWGLGDYGMQTFVHEIGHALGLRHPGRYFGDVSYEDDAIFEKDTWQYSVMSYFDQSNLDGHERYVISSPQLADLAAIRELYGEIELRPGDDVYSLASMGIGRKAGTFTIADTGGRDLVDLTGTKGATLDLRAGQFSTLGVHDDNVAIAYGTRIEDALGSDKADSIRGNDAANALEGARGADTLTGGSGADTLTGGIGSDVLAGSKGADVFVYRTAAQVTGDLILDFQAGQDRVDVSTIDAELGVGGDQPFAFIGDDVFAGVAGELRAHVKAGDTLVKGDLDGDGRADFTLKLAGELSLAGSDFVV